MDRRKLKVRMTDFASLVSGLSLAAWIYLIAFRGRFWRSSPVLERRAPADAAKVAAIVPARNEAALIARGLGSLLHQDYAGEFAIVLIDDNSTDGTAAIAASLDGSGRLNVVRGAPLPAGWSGKLWAVHQGLGHPAAKSADFLFLTDADIEHEPDHLQALVAKAGSEGLDLVSEMVRLHCETTVERALIPAFVFFFQMLYPFPWVNDPHRTLAGAAGGCMLLRREALEKAGGFAAMRAARIDDCTLAALLKPHGAIWLGLGTESHSLRDYRQLGEIWRMVARSAYVQLRFSPWRLLGATLVMTFLYAGPVGGLLYGLWTENVWLAMPTLLASLLMLTAYVPTLRLYSLNPLRAFSLPIAALFYTLMTLDSARRHYGGRGGAWKGRHYSAPGQER